MSVFSARKPKQAFISLVDNKRLNIRAGKHSENDRGFTRTKDGSYRRKRKKRNREETERGGREEEKANGNVTRSTGGPCIWSREIAASFLGRQLITDIMF